MEHKDEIGIITLKKDIRTGTSARKVASSLAGEIQAEVEFLPEEKSFEGTRFFTISRWRKPPGVGGMLVVSDNQLVIVVAGPPDYLESWNLKHQLDVATRKFEIDHAPPAEA